MAGRDELIEKRGKREICGGERAVQKQHAGGKYTARERLMLLFDADSFVESGLFMRHRCTTFDMAQKEAPADGVITGHGKIDGRLVFACAQDFTVMGGSLGETHAEKIAKTQEAALCARAPIVFLNDSGGARIQEGVSALAGYSHIFFNNTRASGVIPQISAVMGPCAGGAVYSPALTDFVFMVEQTSQMFITGPQVIRAVTGEDTDAQTLGGASTHCSVSGCAHFSADSEEACLMQIRQLLSFLPQNNAEEPPKSVFVPFEKAHVGDIASIVPENRNRAYDMAELIRLLSDDGQFLEYDAQYAKNLLTGFLRIDGKSVGVVASQPKIMAGCLDINASDKAARFIRTCDVFNIPLLTLVDVPGYLPGLSQEQGGIIRHGAKLLYAYAEATVPKITVVIRKAYGGAYIGMCSKPLGADLVLAWPEAEIAVMGAEGAVNIIFSNEIAQASDPEAQRAAKIEAYQRTTMQPYAAAERGYVDDIILPEETRGRIIDALEAFSNKKVCVIEKKHGNIPL